MNIKWIVKSEVSALGDFEMGVDDLFKNISEKKGLLRIVLFGNPKDNAEYTDDLNIAKRLLSKYMPDNEPVFSFIAQKPLGKSEIIAECHYLEDYDIYNIDYCTNNGTKYIRIATKDETHLIIGGIQGADINENVRTQSDEAFQKIDGIFKKEGFPVCSIIRQWNYLENITGIIDNRQRYQEFNDSRSEFYSKASWKNGYPAATGIGTSKGGVTIDLNALKTDSDKIRINAVDNKLQICAHDYSKEILVGAEDRKKTTPKFERAKSVYEICGDDKQCVGNIFISGTAAIRGEKSLNNQDIEQQTIVTVENIDELIKENDRILQKENLFYKSELSFLRVYIKNEDDYDFVNEKLKILYPNKDLIYVNADVCRDELLIEIEGIGHMM